MAPSPSAEAVTESADNAASGTAHYAASNLAKDELQEKVGGNHASFVDCALS